MAGPGPVKTVCFIASLFIAWGLFEIGESIVFWSDYKINGTLFTPIPWRFLVEPIRITHVMSILAHGFLLHGIRKEATKFMLPWILMFFIFELVTIIPAGIYVSTFSGAFSCYLICAIYSQCFKKLLFARGHEMECQEMVILEPCGEQ